MRIEEELDNTPGITSGVIQKGNISGDVDQSKN